MGISELAELKQLRDENTKLKRLVADLSLGKHILQEIVAKGLSSLAPGALSRSGSNKPTKRVNAGRRGCST